MIPISKRKRTRRLSTHRVVGVSFRIGVLSCAAAFLALPTASGATLILEQGLDGYAGWGDTSMFSENENSGGGTDGVFAGTNGQFDTRRALLRVDLSAIPPGSTINSVSLNLTVMMSGETFGNIDYTLHRVSADWGEGTVVGLSEGGFGAAADAGDATWQSNFHMSSAWISPGGDYAASPSATGTAGLAGTTGTWSSAGMAADVQAWVDNPGSNYGWALVSTIEGQFKRVKKFHSSEAATNRPRVVIDYAVPAATPNLSGVALATLAATLLLAAFIRKRSVRLEVPLGKAYSDRDL